MFERFCHDRVALRFEGAEAGIEPLTWGQKAFLQDMQESGNQFSMGGMLGLPEGGTVEDAVALVSGLIGRHAALRMRLDTDDAGRLCQDVAASGRMDLNIVTIPHDADRSDVERYAADLMTDWPSERFDFHRDWPLRMALVEHRGSCLYLVWVLSHLVADGGAHLLLLDDMLAHRGGAGPTPDARSQILDIARREKTQNVRQVSSRAMRYWESQLKHVPAQTFGEPVRPPDQAGHRYWQVRFGSPAAHLAVLAIGRRTGTDVSRVTLAVVATAIARVIGVNPLTIKVMVNNRFMPGMADVIAPIAQNSVLTIDTADVSIDEVVVRARSAMLSAGMRAYYDPDELREVSARLDAQRGYPATVTCRINDQRVMVMRAESDEAAGEITPQQVRQRLAESSLTWLGPREHMHEQANILIENKSDVLSLHMMWDLWSLTISQVEALMRAVEDVAVEAAFDPAAPTKVSTLNI
ncbi:MAG TPA: condensation domain-containing protein [Candidatus Limnocylindrales bacterium]|nr:condensation domain-containing protein [Candidatus Limnocylindrales bacterium]